MVSGKEKGYEILTEHKAAVRRGDSKNGRTVVHVQKYDNHVDWEAARVIDQKQHGTTIYWPRRIRDYTHSKQGQTIDEPGL